MYGETLSYETLLIIAADCMRQMRGSAREADYMTRDRTGRYWGEEGFLEDYRKTLRALEFLVEKGEVSKKEKRIEINWTPTIVTEYHLRSV